MIQIPFSNPKYARIWQIMPDYARLCQIWQNMPDSARSAHIFKRPKLKNLFWIPNLPDLGAIYLKIWKWDFDYTFLLLFILVPDQARFWLIAAKSYLIRHSSGIPSLPITIRLFQVYQIGIRCPADASQASIIPHLNCSFYPHTHLFLHIYFSTKVSGGTEPSR